jgi:hypothetical protein
MKPKKIARIEPENSSATGHLELNQNRICRDRAAKIKSKTKP